MEYITVEQFREQPVEVQQVFLDWWKPSIGDVFAWNYSAGEKDNDLHKLQCCTSELVTNLTECNKGLKEGDRIPLLTEGQLRQFIEDNLKGKVDLSCLEIMENTCLYEISVYEIKECNMFGKCYEFPNIEAQDLLQVYWQIACLIAMEEISNE